MRTVGRIPRNMGGGTVWGGMLKTRNCIEAAIIIGIIYLLTKALALFIPYLITVGIRLALWLVFGLLAIRGIGGEPLSVYLLNIINYSNTRTYVTLQPPQREGGMPSPKKSRLETFADWMFTSGEKKPSSSASEKKSGKEKKAERKEARKRKKQAKEQEKAERKMEKRARKDAKRERKERKRTK